ncbi:MAG: hypothetical protein HQ573_04725 [Desulfobacteraceae bacterium]|nr:hypothetical protein [Desulfobacteraceae bacterium]
MKRTAIIFIVGLLLTAAGSLFIYKKHLQVKADIEASFNERQLMLANRILLAGGGLRC